MELPEMKMKMNLRPLPLRWRWRPVAGKRRKLNKNLFRKTVRDEKLLWELNFHGIRFTHSFLWPFPIRSSVVSVSFS